MNYEGFKGVRSDIAVLSQKMYELNIRMRQLTQKYYWNSEELVERLSGQVLNDAQVEFEKIYSKINELEHHFKD